MLRVRAERLRRGWTLEAVYLRTGISPADLSQLERGLHQPFPGWKRRLERLYRVPADELFQEVEDGEEVER